MNGIISELEAAILKKKAEVVFGKSLLSTKHYNKFFEVKFLRIKDAEYKFGTTCVWVMSIKGDEITLGIHDTNGYLDIIMKHQNPFYYQ